MKMFFLYQVNDWHSYDSRELIGLCDSLEIVIDLLIEYIGTDKPLSECSKQNIRLKDIQAMDNSLLNN